MPQFEALIRKDLHDFTPYSSARMEAKAGGVFLNANESPFKKDPLGLNRYPDDPSKALLESMSAFYNVKPSEVLITRGSDEGIDLITRLFCTAYQDSVLICPPSFLMYDVCAKLQGADVLEVPLLADNNFQLDVEGISKAWHEQVKIIFLCSPNNPTANLIKQDDLLAVCTAFAGKSIVVIDEAYIEYTHASSFAAYINQFDNLVVLRTLSKAFGQAGSRLGVTLANEHLIHWLSKILAAYPLPRQTLDAAQQVFQKSYLENIPENIQLITTERQRLSGQLDQVSHVKKVYPSDTNFLLVEFNNSDTVMKHCHSQGVVLRNMSQNLNLSNCIRITVGLPEENQKLLECLITLR